MRDRRLLELVAALLLAGCAAQHDGAPGGGSRGPSPVPESADSETPPRSPGASATNPPRSQGASAISPDAAAPGASPGAAGQGGLTGGGAITGGGSPITSGGGALTGGGVVVTGSGGSPPIADSLPRLGAKVVQLAAGGYTFCVRLADGGVSCWGDLATRKGVFPPEPMPGLAGAIDVQITGHSGCALFANGKVRCWGENGAGQLGDGLRVHGTCESPNDRDCSAEPVEVKGVTDAVEIAVGGWSNCARSAAGGVQCWGSLPTSLVGEAVNCIDGLNKGCTHTPVTLPGIRDARAIVLGDGGYREVCILRTDNSPYCLSFDAKPFTRVPDMLEVFHERACAVVGGEVICWGTTPYGSNGDGRLDHPTTPQAGPELNPPRAALGIRDASSVALGGSGATCALHRDGHVSCWGLNADGLVDDGNATHESCARLWPGEGPKNVDCSATPRSVRGIASAKTLSLSSSTACITDASDQLVCWGRFASDFGSSEPRSATPIEGARGLTSLNLLGTGGCGVDMEGGVVCWGEHHQWMAKSERSSPTAVVRILAP